MVSDNRSRRRVLRAVGTIGGVGVLGTQSVGAQQPEPLDRHIVGLEPGQAAVARDAAAEVYRTLDFGAIGQAVSGWFTEAAIAGLSRNPNVRYVEPEGVMEAIDHATDENDGDPSAEQVLPWGIDRVDADVAHHEGETGGGSSVSIIDTGIDPEHETLEVTDGRAFVNCRGSCAEDWDDDHGHGTHCAGIADALDNDVGVVGASTAADLYAVKVLDGNGSGTWSDVAAGIEWTADRGIDVASLSLGGDTASETVRDACEYAYGEGTLLVAAAGNDGPDADSVGYPAAYEECIAVSATDENDEIADFSSRGDEVELAAPGVDVLSSLPDDEYDRWNGTSMACPHVSGAGAQLMEHQYTNVEARQRLNETAEDVGLARTEQGNGLVDVAAALGIDDGGDDGDSDGELSIDTFAVENKSNPRWTRADVEWAVSSSTNDGELEMVTSVLHHENDDESAPYAEEASAVDGFEADGEHDLRTDADGLADDDAEVTLLVETSETKISETKPL